MSTFGNKALKSWDYDFTDTIRFNRTPKDVQMKILEKWYPIGMEVTMIGTSFTYTICGYSNRVWGYMIDARYKSTVITAHPSRFRPTENWLKMVNREDKLNGLLG